MQELVFPLKEPLQTSGAQSLKLDLYRQFSVGAKKSPWVLWLRMFGIAQYIVYIRACI